MIRIASHPLPNGANPAAAGALLPLEWEEELLPSDARSRWLIAAIIGIAMATLVFLCIAWIIPETESLKPPDLSGLLKIAFQPENLKVASSTRRETPQKELRPLEQPRKTETAEKKSGRPRPTSAARPVRSTAGPRASAMRPSGMGLNINISGMGAGGGGPAINIRDAGSSYDFADQATEFVRREERRAKARDSSYLDRARPPSDEAGAGGKSAAVGRTSPAMPIHTPKPEYTREMRKQQLEGFVILRVLISRTGTVEKHEIIDADPEGVFEDLVVAKLPQWSFAPAKDEDGNPIEAWEEFELIFSMED